MMKSRHLVENPQIVRNDADQELDLDSGRLSKPTYRTNGPYEAIEQKDIVIGFEENGQGKNNNFSPADQVECSSHESIPENQMKTKDQLRSRKHSVNVKQVVANFFVEGIKDKYEDEHQCGV